MAQSRSKRDTICSTTATDQLVGKFGRPTPIRVSPKTLVDFRTCRMDALSCISLSSQFDSELILAKQFLCVLACYYFICNFYGENSRCTFPWRWPKTDHPKMFFFTIGLAGLPVRILKSRGSGRSFPNRMSTGSHLSWLPLSLKQLSTASSNWLNRLSHQTQFLGHSKGRYLNEIQLNL